jgi:hypothetical protein
VGCDPLVQQPDSLIDVVFIVRYGIGGESRVDVLLDGCNTVFLSSGDK